MVEGREVKYLDLYRIFVDMLVFIFLEVSVGNEESDCVGRKTKNVVHNLYKMIGKTHIVIMAIF